MLERGRAFDFHENPEKFYAQEIGHFLTEFLVEFRNGEIDKETVHQRVWNGVESALQGIEMLKSKKD